MILVSLVCEACYVHHSGFHLYYFCKLDSLSFFRLKLGMGVISGWKNIQKESGQMSQSIEKGHRLFSVNLLETNSP